jgi:hypothetical protein
LPPEYSGLYAASFVSRSTNLHLVQQKIHKSFTFTFSIFFVNDPDFEFEVQHVQLWSLRLNGVCAEVDELK